MAPTTEDAGSTGAAPATTTLAAPLKAAADVGATLTKDVHKVEWNGQVSENSFHLFVNETGEELELYWGDELRDNLHSTVAPHANTFVGTYNFHTWRVRSKSRGLIATYTGPSVILTVTEDGHSTQPGQRSHQPASASGAGHAGQAVVGAAAVAAGSAAASAAQGDGSGSGGAAHSSEPGYRQRSTVLGMPIWAFDGVSDAAVSRVVHIVGSMLANSPAALLERLVAGGASFAVFGTDQVVTDVPAHRFMRYNTGRDLDTSARGLGATPTVPVTSCGEENLTMEGDRWYPCQSILIHEVGHMVHNMGMPPGPDGVEGVLEAYRAAMKARLYPKGCYMATNEQEYWAVAVESWFESTVREDVNGGVKTRAALKKHDPRLAALLEAAFGDGDWRYWKDCPRPLAMPTRASAAAAAAARPAAAAPAAAAVAPVPPSWRSRRPAKLMVDSLLDNSDSSAAVRLLLRRMLCRRFFSIRRRRGSGKPPPAEAGATAAAAAATDEKEGIAQQELVEGVGGASGAASAAATAAAPASLPAAAAAGYLPPPLPVPMVAEVPPPLPSARRGSGGRGAAKGRGSRRRKEAEEQEVAEEEEEDEEEGEGAGSDRIEVPPPLPVPLPEPEPLPLPPPPLFPGPAPPLSAAAAAATAAPAAGGFASR